jgi:PKD repeat protein
MKKSLFKIMTLLVVLITTLSCKKESPPFANMKLRSTAFLFEEVFFTSKCENAGTVEWDFGDGSDAKGETVRHKYMFPGLFTVKITATNDAGTDTYSQAILIKSGEAEYNVSNEMTYDIIFFAFAINSYGELEEYEDVGLVKAGRESDFFLTRTDGIYLGGSTPDFDFVCQNPYTIQDYQQNKLVFNSKTSIIIQKKKSLKKGGQALKELLEEIAENHE